MRIGTLYRAAAAVLAAAVSITIAVPGQANAIVYKVDPMTFDNFNTDSTLTLTECQRSAAGSIVVPDRINNRGVSAIAPKAFFSCMEITDIELPEYMSSIGMSAFSHCYMLETIKLPLQAKEIGGSAFSYCSSLRDVMLPQGIEEVSSCIFYGCSSLESVMIPNTVREIGSSAFTQCTSLTDVYFSGTQEEWEQIGIGLPNTELAGAKIHFWEDGWTDDQPTGPVAGVPSDPVGGGPSDPGDGSTDEPVYDNPADPVYDNPVDPPTEPASAAEPTRSGAYWGIVGGGGLPGDANCDGKVNVSDAVAVLQFIANQEKYSLYGAAYNNADCDGEPGVTGGDAIYIQMIDAGLR